jgi:hypothetical protein
MKEKIANFLETKKSTFKSIGVVIFVVASLLGGFSVGYLYNQQYGPKKPTIQMIKVNRSQVNLAIDENNHLIVIDKTTGDYTVYQDSIGISIFKLYANNIYINKSK